MTSIRPPSDFFLFDLEPPPEQVGPIDVVAFVSGTEVDVDLLIESLRGHLRRSSPPARLLLLGPEPAREAIEVAASDRDLADALPAFTRWNDTPPLHTVLFDEKGGLSAPGGELPEVGTEEFSQRLLWQGVYRIFQEQKGMLRSSPGSHYVNPSGKHTQGFIRAGNVLLHSAEVAYLAMGLLKWWPRELRRIFVDTASISSVAYALIALRQIFEPDLVPPTIDSFSSYDGVHDFKFEREHALCLISASTSGGLEEEMVDNEYLPAERIATLFYCGPKPKGRARILCDLTPRDGRPGEQPPRSFKRKEECELCRRGSTTIRISGDQFLPANPEVRDVVLTAGDAPGWLSSFLEAVVGAQVLRCHGGATGGGRPREVYVHLQDATRQQEEGPFSEALTRRLKTTVPASLAKIVYVDHPSSRALAEAVAEHFNENGKTPLEDDAIVSASSVLRRDVSLKGVTGSVLVVAGAMSSGRTLQGVNQFLRNVSNVKSILYLVGVARTASKADLERVESNLTYDRYPREHPFVTVATAFLPGDYGVEPSPWEGERRLLLTMRRHLEAHPSGEEFDEEAIAQIEARRQEIGEAVGGGSGGLLNELFLPRVVEGEILFEEGSRMRLREGFVYWRSLPGEAFAAGTQADVYVTVLAILHRLRSAEADGNALVQHEHNRTVLSPANFARFNDGVIQSAMLRAARPSELDYSHDPVLSAQMYGLVRRAIEHRDEDEGEAAPEFLLAFAREQFKLTKDDADDLRLFLAGLSDLPPLMRAIGAWLNRKSPPAASSEGEEAPEAEPVASSG